MAGKSKATEWYYESNGERTGPVSPKELKRLADTGSILQSTLVWREGMSDWVKAGDVKGLVPRVDDGAAPPQRHESGGGGMLRAIKDWYQGTWLSKRSLRFQIVAGLFCWHLIILWYFLSKPKTNQSSGKPDRKAEVSSIVKRLLIGGAVFVIIVLSISTVVTIVSIRGGNAAVSEGDRLWDDGKKSEAIAKYQKVLDDHMPIVSSERRGRLFSRLFDHYASEGMETKAKSILDQCIDPADLKPQTDVGRRLLEKWLAGQITADYFPFASGTTRHYIQNIYGLGPEIQERIEWKYSSDRTIKSRIVNQFVVGGGDLPAQLGSDDVLHFRQADGMIELGESSEYTNGVAWSPSLKLGTTEGENWEVKYDNGVTKSYHVVGFEKREINENIDGGGEVFCVVVEMIMTAPIGPEIIVRSTYAKGVGRISEEAWIVENGRRTMTRSVVIMPVLSE